MDLQFGHYQLKQAERQVLGPEGPVELSARAFDILAVLLAKPGEVIGKEEMFEAVWPGVVVEENTLQVHVSGLRKALDPGMIATVHGRGYKYAGPPPVFLDPGGQAAPAEARPSIAVLPFDNLSGDPEQSYFSDGITEDIIAELGKFREFLVIARNSSFQFRGLANGAAEVAEKLGVQYLVKGSVRRSGNRVRVSVQLIDASSAAHVWAEHYDRQLDDIFAIQDEITQMIAARLARQARTASVARARKRPTGSMSAYDCYLRALQLAAVYDTVLQAEPDLRKAVELDPGFAGAHAMLGFVEAIKFYWDNGLHHLEAGLQMARTALQLDSEEAYGHMTAGFALLYLRRFREAEASFGRAASLNPNDPIIRSFRAVHLNYTGKPEEALIEMEEVGRRDPFAVGWFEDFMGGILTAAGHYREAIAYYAKMASLPPWSLVYLTVCHAELGEMAQAKVALRRFKECRPGLSLDQNIDMEDVFEDPEVYRRYRAILQRVDAET